MEQIIICFSGITQIVLFKLEAKFFKENLKFLSIKTNKKTLRMRITRKCVCRTCGFFQSYSNPIQAVFVSGPLLIQTYFVMSGFLLAYKMQIYFKRNNVNVIFLPRLIFFRWLRYV